MSGKYRLAPFGFKAPDSDSVIVSCGKKDGLGRVEVHTADRFLVVFKSVEKGTETVVPQLDWAWVECHEGPRSVGVERYTFYSGTLGFEFF